ncbi:hypothetical protein KUTeg_022629, partial [Tegillarca granosa]
YYTKEEIHNEDINENQEDNLDRNEKKNETKVQRENSKKSKSRENSIKQRKKGSESVVLQVGETNPAINIDDSGQLNVDEVEMTQNGINPSVDNQKDFDVDNRNSELKSGTGASVKNIDHDSIDHEEFGKGEGKDEPDSASVFSYYMVHDARYYFQHPYCRLFVAYFVTFCNFLIYAEDPVAHSMKECTIPLIGNDFAFVCTRYPPSAWSLLKVLLWLSAMVIGMLLGKYLIHKLLLNKVLRLQMFTECQGSWMIMFMVVLIILFIFSWIYNGFLMIGGDATLDYRISDLMGLTNSIFMKMAATGTWCGKWFNYGILMIVMILDLNMWKNQTFYEPFNYGQYTDYDGKIMTVVDSYSLTKLNRTLFTYTYRNMTFDPNTNKTFLSGDKMMMSRFYSFALYIKILAFIPRKWFNYGILFLVMILDLNMWKNQIFYSPFDFGQYVDGEAKIHTVLDDYSLKNFNESQFTYSFRNSTLNPLTNLSYYSGDGVMNSRYYNISLSIKGVAFIPSLLGFVIFGLLIWFFGRFKPTVEDPYAGRLIKRKRKKKFSIRNLRDSFRRKIDLRKKVQAVPKLLKFTRRNTENRQHLRNGERNSGYPENLDMFISASIVENVYCI